MTTRAKRKKSRYNLDEPCPNCGQPLEFITGISKAYLECKNRHVVERRQMCDVGSCRRIARQTGWSHKLGVWAACEEHVYTASGGAWF